MFDEDCCQQYSGQLAHIAASTPRFSPAVPVEPNAGTIVMRPANVRMPGAAPMASLKNSLYSGRGTPTGKSCTPTGASCTSTAVASQQSASCHVLHPQHKVDANPEGARDASMVRGPCKFLRNAERYSASKRPSRTVARLLESQMLLC